MLLFSINKELLRIYMAELAVAICLWQDEPRNKGDIQGDAVDSARSFRVYSNFRKLKWWILLDKENLWAKLKWQKQWKPLETNLGKYLSNDVPETNSRLIKYDTEDCRWMEKTPFILLQEGSFQKRRRVFIARGYLMR